MTDLGVFAAGCFDLVFHPCSNCFVPDVRPVWREAYRVLRGEGVLLSGFTNPVRYLFDDERTGNGRLTVRHAIPYSDRTGLSPAEQDALRQAGEPWEFGHTLEDQIGGQLDAGFLIAGFYEDRYPTSTPDPLSNFLPTFVATRAVKPAGGRLQRHPSQPASR
jgi:hypothetical protein